MGGLEIHRKLQFGMSTPNWSQSAHDQLRGGVE